MLDGATANYLHIFFKKDRKRSETRGEGRG